MSDDIVLENGVSNAPESADGTLVVVVCRAKHLPNRRKLDKQNPYVTLRIGTVARKTPSHFRAGQTPEWTHEVRFELSRDRKPIMIVDVLDETKNEPTPIGNVEIDCSKIFANPANQDRGKYIYDNWFDLNMFGKRAGMIYLEMTFYPSAPILPPKISNHNLIVKEEQSIYDPENRQHEYVHDPLPLSSHHSHSSFVDNQISPYKSPPSRLDSPSRLPYDRSNSLTNFPNIKKHSPSKVPVSHMKYSQSEYTPSFQPNPSAKQKSVFDDVFVNSQNSDKSTFLKHLSFLKNSASTNATDVSKDSFFENNSSTKENDHKKPSKWHKFANKFKSKEPISTLWQGEKSSEPELKVDFEHSYLNQPQNLKYDYQNEDDDRDYMAPLPPPHLIESNIASSSVNGTFAPPTPVHKTTTARKPPPSKNYLDDKLTTSIPFSADTIGLTDDELPTQVYLLDKKVKSLTFSNPNQEEHNLNPNEIDPRYYAPTPSDKLNTRFRLQEGHPRKQDLEIDFRTHETGYLGNGKFSPTVFQRINQNHSYEDDDQENKPKVPPKVPKGLTNQEYYAIAKDQYLRDLNGKRL